MKKFKWALQRLLEVTERREEALRAGLFDLSQRMATVRQEIVRRRAVLRALLSDLSGMGIDSRIAGQEVFMKYTVTGDREMKQLNEKVKALELRRKEETEKLMKTRTSRQTLDRLRAEAMQRHVREQLRLEQKQLDQSAHVSHASKAARIARGAG